MASAQLSQEVWHSHDRQTLGMGSPRPHHRSRSIHLSDHPHPVRAVARKSGHGPGVSHEGANVRIFSHTADKWVDGEVMCDVGSNLVRVEYEAGEYWYGKTLHVHSKHLRFLSDMPATPSTTPAMPSAMESVPARSTSATMNAGPFHGCRSSLPVGPANLYIELDYVWMLLEQEAVALISGKWLLERSKVAPFDPLPCRQHLPCDAQVDIKKLRSDFCFPPIVAISHCWLNPNHPDPDGNVLKELAPVIEAYLAELSVKSFHRRNDAAFFFAWCSLYQPYHATQKDGKYHRLKDPQLTEEQEKSHRKALESMDIWYTHEKTEVWMLTKFFDGQGDAYMARGWPTWESRVAQLLSKDRCVLDLGSLDERQLSKVRDRMQHVVFPCDGTYASQCNNARPMEHIRKICAKSREIPLLPEDFDVLIDGKTFTCGSTDLPLIKNNYKQNFYNVVSCIEKGCFSSTGWSSNFQWLQHARTLDILDLTNNDIDDAASSDLAQVLQCLSKLEKLHLSGNQIGDKGACAIAQGLRHCRNLGQLFLDDNLIGDDGACALANGLKDCNNLWCLSLQYNKIRDDGACAIAQRLGHLGRVIRDDRACATAQEFGHLGQVDLSHNPIEEAGVRALGASLPDCTILLDYGNSVWMRSGIELAYAFAE